MIELFDVQTAAITKSAQQRGFGYLMEQGLGKTSTVLSEFLTLSEQGLAQRLVVLCPNTFKSGWVDEIEKQGAPLSPFVMESGNEQHTRRFISREHNTAPVLIVNYEAIRSDATMALIREFIKGRSAYIAADESIQISNHDSQQTKAAISLSKDFEYRRILSGKWMKQGPHEFWSQLRFIGMLDGYNYFAFKNRYCLTGGFRGKQIVGARNEQELAALVDPYVFKALKKDWTTLPPKLSTIREYKMTGPMLQHFNSMLNDFVTLLSNGDVVAVDIALSKYAKLAQIQTGFIYDEEGKVHELVPDSSNPRLNLLMNIMSDEVTGKVIVPYIHRHSEKVLRRALAAYQPAAITGGMSPEEISAEKKRFNEDPNCRVILLNKGAKYGHTLNGGPEPENHCSTMVFYENDYSLDWRSQIEDRNHRHGQLGDACLYIDLVGTLIDKNIVTALQRKEDVFQSIMKFITTTVRRGDA